jgi:gluconolactonase
MDRARRSTRVGSKWVLVVALALACGCGSARDVDSDSSKPDASRPTKTKDASVGDSHVPRSDAGEADDDEEDAGAEHGGATGDANSYPALKMEDLGVPVQVASGFGLAEGPLWDPCGKQLLFTDTTANIVHTLSPDDELGVFMEDTDNANGLAFDIDGSLILAQMGGAPGHIARRSADGSVEQLGPAQPALHTPDDVIVRSDGTIYFTDGDFPPIGSFNFGALPIYSLAPGADEFVNQGMVMGPNGIEFSPDEATLYVDAYFEGTVVKFDVAADGSTSNRSVFASGLTTPDSLCVDAGGNLYVGVSTGLAVFRPDGTPVGLIPVAGAQGVTNCAFGGKDGKTLYITAWTIVLKLEAMPIPGLDWVVNRKRVQC